MNRRQAIKISVGATAALAGAGAAWWQLRPGGAGLPEDFWSLRFDRPEGGELQVAALRGRPTLLNFWATWCAPCVSELPLLDRFQREQGSRGWQVVALAIDNPIPVREFLRQRPLGVTVGLAGSNGVDLARSLGNDQGGLPFTVVLDSAGTARERKLGALQPGDLARWATTIS